MSFISQEGAADNANAEYAVFDFGLICSAVAKLDTTLADSPGLADSDYKVATHWAAQHWLARTHFHIGSYKRRKKGALCYMDIYVLDPNGWNAIPLYMEFRRHRLLRFADQTVEMGKWLLDSHRQYLKELPPYPSGNTD